MGQSDLESIDVEKLSAWLDSNAPELGDGPLQMKSITGGSTNMIIELDRGSTPAILRSPPFVATPQGAKTIEREATVLRALEGTGVPHPGFHVWCPDPGVIGVPFYIMDKVDGWAATITEQNETLYVPRFDGGADQHYLGYAMVDGMIAMANLDYQAAGLQNFGKPDGFLARQVDRWLGQRATYPQRYPKYQLPHLEGLDYVVDWLRANLPDESRPGLMHGDYALNNVLFHHNPPARLIAIIDWETATIGDPMLDMAAFAQSLKSDKGQVTRSYFDSTNFPTRADALEYYAENTGLDVSRIDYYLVLTRFKAACMIEYKVAEAVQGLAPKAKGDRFDALVRGIIVDAAAYAKSLG